MTAAIILVIMICVNHSVGVGMHIINNDDVEVSIDNDLQVAIITAATSSSAVTAAVTISASIRGIIGSMTTIAVSLYDWIRIANEARERIDLPVGTIEEAIATLETAFGDTYLAGLLPANDDHSKRIVTARDDRPLAYWLSGPGLDAAVVQLVETAVVLRAFLGDTCLAKKIDRIKNDTFWPTFYELAMAFRVKRSLEGRGSLELSPEIEKNNGDFIVTIDGGRLLCECSRVSRTPVSEEGIRITQDIFDCVADKIRPYARPCAVKVRIPAELKRADYQMIVQLLKRTLERHERSGEVSVASSQQGAEVQVEPLTDQTEKIPFTMVDGHIVDMTGSEWVHAHSIGGVAGKSSAEVSEMFRAGVEYDYRERGRVFLKYTPPQAVEDPYARLTDKIHKKVSQTKIEPGTRTAKFLWIDSPYGLRTLDHQKLQQMAVQEMRRSRHTLGVAITYRKANPHFRHQCSVLGVLNQNGLPDFPDFARPLKVLRDRSHHRLEVSEILGGGSGAVGKGDPAD